VGESNPRDLTRCLKLAHYPSGLLGFVSLPIRRSNSDLLFAALASPSPARLHRLPCADRFDADRCLWSLTVSISAEKLSGIARPRATQASPGRRKSQEKNEKKRGRGFPTDKGGERISRLFLVAGG